MRFRHPGRWPAWCCAQAGADPGAPTALLAARFAKWQLPDAIELVDALQCTSTGKFRKARLREKYRQWRWPAQGGKPPGPGA